MSGPEPAPGAHLGAAALTPLEDADGVIQHAKLVGALERPDVDFNVEWGERGDGRWDRSDGGRRRGGQRWGESCTSRTLNNPLLACDGRHGWGVPLVIPFPLPVAYHVALSIRSGR